MSSVFGEMSDILMDNLWPLRYDDDFVPTPMTAPPCTPREREERYMTRYSAIFDCAHPIPPPTGLWAACSKVRLTYFVCKLTYHRICFHLLNAKMIVRIKIFT